MPSLFNHLLSITNGFLIDKEYAEKLANFNLWQVDINILSSKPNEHDAITKIEGSQQRAINAIKLLKERGLRVTMQSSIKVNNKEGAKNIKELANSLGVDVDIYPIHEQKSR